MSKGFAWLPVAIGVIFIAEILIFSLAFTKITIFARETTDSNIVFEGDEIETYVRAIDNSVQLSVAQALYDFQAGNQGFWEDYTKKTIPVPDGSVIASVHDYENVFLQKFAEFQAKSGHEKIIFPTEIGKGQVSIMDKIVSMKFPPGSDKKFTLTKDAFGLAHYERSFVPESTLTTFFGEMYKEISFLINNDLFGKAAFSGLSKADASNTLPACDTTGLTSHLNLPSYLDNDAACSGVSHGCVGCEGGDQAGVCGKGGGPSDFGIYGASSTGVVDFCTATLVYNICDKGDPGDPRFKHGKVSPEPSDDQVYSLTHAGNSFGSAVSKTMQRTKEHAACLVQELDSNTLVSGDMPTDYTVSGDNTVASKSTNDHTRLVADDGLCLCQPVGLCPSNGSPNPDTRWICHRIKTKTVSTSYHFATSGTITYKEDGFVYGFIQQLDNIKLIFQVKVGNKALI